MTNKNSTTNPSSTGRASPALKEETAKHEKRVFVGGLILSTAWIASSYWTFLGFMQTAEETANADFTGTVEALLAAVVSAVVVAGCCGLLLGFSGAGAQIKRTILLGICLAPFVLGISTVNAINGLSSAPGLYFDMKERAGEWQNYANVQLAAPGAARTVADTLAPSRKSICTTAGLEESEGLITGSAGKGALSAALVSACSALLAIDDTLKETVLRNDERVQHAANIAEELLDIPEQQNLGIFDRQDAFREALAPLKNALAAADSENLQQKIKAQVAILANNVATLETRDSAFGERQRAAVAALKTQLQSVETILNRFLNETAPLVAQEEPADLLSSGAAIARWWPRLLPQILAAIGVDLAILWIAGLLAVSRASLREMKVASKQNP